ncbi:FadR family transcriptional regulator [Rhizobium pusense]|uniref:FadR/GntR family transcriptional regulator n=1 Tax=Agrobacterium pusense TaxID=648995 RepID=UPI001C6E0214|nr:FadR/GntR family transcriptional regulator [Agrobacterium pusense]MBW9076363.1 FadR family transcriptional regulator [Agrobacterium pusense]
MIESKGRVRGGLVRRVAGELRAQIMDGHFEVGHKLPSQAELCEKFAVSRTVIREAVANLQADGLLEAHQGAGIFVTSRSGRPSDGFQAVDRERVSSMLEILELRTAIEIEAAGLSAIRRSPVQEEAILAAHNTFKMHSPGSEESADADFLFHRMIAASTNNPRFGEMLDLLGRSVIPRATLPNSSDIYNQAYLELITEEHRTIVDAILAGDERAAREAMKAHLKGSQKRYRSLLRS